jgi:acetolactate synthase-1/2/3 large subunit
MQNMLPQLHRDALQIKTEILSGARIIMRCLAAEGVDTIFGYPGGAILPVYDVLAEYENKITHYLVRHEQAAIHAAQGYARATGKIACVFVTSGPGATNLVTGLADALMDSTPVLCITGQVPSSLLGTDAFQEADVLSITTPVTKWNKKVTDACEIADGLSKAFFIASSGRPGPVLIDITKDAQLNSTPFNYESKKGLSSYQPVPEINEIAIEEAAELINKAKKPFILCGQGVILSGASKELLLLAEKAGIPIACTLQGLSAVPTDHPLYVGYLGLHGNYAPNINTNECDVLIAIGMRFDDRVTGNLEKYSKQAKVIHIDIDATEINKLVPAHIAVHADARGALMLLLPKVKVAQHTGWLQSFKVLYQKEYDIIIHKNEILHDDSITMGQVIYSLNEVSKGLAVIVTDVGQHQMVASRYCVFKDPRTNITSGGMGTMGFALPAAIGAKIGNRDAQVFAIIGDAGVQMTIQELGTIAQYNIAVKIIVLNNNYLGMVRQLQQFYYGQRYSAVEMTNPDFIKIAEAYGIRGKKIVRSRDLKKTIKEMWECEGPYFLEVEVEKEESVFPTMPTGGSVSDLMLSF